MAEEPKAYEGLGPSNLAPLANKVWTPDGAALSPEDYFVLTRVDGRTSLRQLVLISGFPEARALAILRRLRAEGAILFPGEAPPPPKPRPAPGGAGAPEAVDAVRERSGPVITISDDDPLLGETVDLGLDQKRAILVKHRSLASATYFDVLEVPVDVDKRALKAAYRRLSKEFHPDRFFGKRLGSYKAMLAEIFDIASTALEVLTDLEKRAEYVESLDTSGMPPARRRSPARVTEASDTPPVGVNAMREKSSTHPHGIDALTRERAAKLYEDAALHHVTGELEKALPEFAQAIAIDPQPRYLRRGAEAALRAQELRLAEEYAKKAQELDANNATSHRVLGKVYAASGRPEEARAALETALRLDPENLHIAAELRAIVGQTPIPSTRSADDDD